MTVFLDYGKTSFSLPESILASADILSPPAMPHSLPETQIVPSFMDALENPAAGPPLFERIKPGGSTCIVVSDKTRAYGVSSWLPALLDSCNAAGVPDEKIVVLFATGAHAAQTESERRAIAGDTAAARVKLIDHDCDASENMSHLGVTSAGTPVRINRAAAEADNLILTGVVMPHYYAGFTGGRKSILPGVAARESIFANHSLNLAPGGGAHPLASAMSLKGNPIHEDMLEAAALVDVAFSVNVINGGGGGPAAFFAGNISGAHDAACRASAEWMGVYMEKPAPWVIASCGGHPKDISFYQSHKALDNSFRAVEPGGVIVLLAECPEGIGPEGFRDWFAMRDRTAIEAKLREKYVVPGHTALRTLEKTAAAKVVLVSSLPAADVEIMGMIRAADIEDAVKYIDASKRGAIIPAAAVTAPVLKYDSRENRE